MTNAPAPMRPRFSLLLVAAALLAAALPGRLAAQPAQSAPPPVTVPDTLDAYIEQEMEQRRIPGLALAITRRGRVLTERAYGLAGVQNDVPVTTETRFALASLTKQFTAAGVMMLVEEGEIDLDASILRYLPDDAPEAWRPITPRRLLTHTSGLPPIGRGFSGSEGGLYNHLRISTEQSWTAARADTLYTRPGERWAYSDVGFFLLGLMTQRVSGTPWRQFMHERILDPLGMIRTFITDPIGIHHNLAQGYTLRDGTLSNLLRPWQFELPSHFGLFSTVGDLARWDAALYTDRLLSAKSRREMWTPVRLNDGSTYPYGFGWEVVENGPGGYKMLRHTGITGTEIVRVPGASLTVIVLTNLGRGFGGEAHSWGIARQIAQTLLRAPASSSDAGGR